MRVLLVPLILAGCIEQTREPYIRIQPQSNAEIRFVMDVLDGLQDQSIDENREYCGYIGLNDRDEFIASPATKGRQGSCLSDDPPEEMRILASYHTHGGYSDSYDSEVPSVDDLTADRDEGVDGYIATPGGRVWYNDSSIVVSTLLCGLDCITSDNDFEISDFEVPNSFTLKELKEFFR